MEKHLNAIQSHMRDIKQSKFDRLCLPVMAACVDLHYQVAACQERTARTIEKTAKISEDFCSMQDRIAMIPAGKREVDIHNAVQTAAPPDSDDERDPNPHASVDVSMKTDRYERGGSDDSDDSEALDNLRAFMPYTAILEKRYIVIWVVSMYFDDFEDAYYQRRMTRIVDTWRTAALSDKEYETMNAEMTATGTTDLLDARTKLGPSVTRKLMEYAKRHFLSLQGLRRSESLVLK